jgi:peroxiredoxin
VPGELAATYYSQRASAGLIVTEATQISPMGKGYINTPGIHSPEQVRAWSRIVESVHKCGGRIFLQLWHVGRISHSSLLPNNAQPVKALLKKGPVVISFYRGEWCPFCNIELHSLQEALPKINGLGANLIAISPEKPDSGIVMTEKNKLTFPVLSDFKNTVARQFGIVFRVGDELQDFSRTVFKNDLALRNGEDSYELPVPATFVVDASGIVRFAHVEVDYMTGRAEPAEVVAALEAIVRP